MGGEDVEWSVEYSVEILEAAVVRYERQCQGHEVDFVCHDQPPNIILRGPIANIVRVRNGTI
jgi:hypothetical protein